jgi:N12 class adenine-specific DNA methylase
LVKILKRVKPKFLKPEDVQDNDLATIIEPPYIQSADKSKYGKERTIITVRIHRTGEIRRWGLNNTSNDHLVDAYGGEGDSWKDKEVRIQKRLENVRGQDRYVLYALPSVQAEIAPAEKPMVEV